MAENLIPILLLITLVFGAWQLHRFILACRQANRVDWGRGWMNLLDGLNRLFCYRYHGLNLVWLRIPKSGPAILTSNHVPVQANNLFAQRRKARQENRLKYLNCNFVSFASLREQKQYEK